MSAKKTLGAAGQKVPSFCVEVFIAGDKATARRVLRDYCMKDPCCVTLSSTEYVYRGGLEDGVVVGLRNYPRFPSSPEEIRSRANDIASVLMDEMAQDSCMIVDSTGDTVWRTTRDA